MAYTNDFSAIYKIENIITGECYNGNFIKEWESRIITGKMLNIDPTSITKAITKKTKCLESLWSNNKLSRLDYSRKSSFRKVAIFNQDKLIKEYNSLSECGRDLKMTPAGVKYYIDNPILYNGQSIRYI